MIARKRPKLEFGKLDIRGDIMSIALSSFAKRVK